MEMNKLQEARYKSGLTQAQLAEKSGVTLRAIQAYEQGSRDLGKAEIRTVLALAKALRCKPTNLI